MISTTIYVDLDDVLCQTARHFLVIVEREFGKSFPYEQLTNFDIGTACGLRPDERDELYRIVHEPDELLRMAPIAEGINAVSQWAHAGFKIAVVTGRPPKSHEASVDWLGRHRVPYDSFTMVDKYARFAIENTIAISLEELAARQFCWAVEDSLPMAEYLAGEMGVPVALVDRPWNRTQATHGRVNRYLDWQAIASGAPQLTGTGRR